MNLFGRQKFQRVERDAVCRRVPDRAVRVRFDRNVTSVSPLILMGE
jgi:hypothetical protein